MGTWMVGWLCFIVKEYLQAPRLMYPHPQVFYLSWFIHKILRNWQLRLGRRACGSRWRNQMHFIVTIATRAILTSLLLENKRSHHFCKKCWGKHYDRMRHILSGMTRPLDIGCGEGDSSLQFLFIIIFFSTTIFIAFQYGLPASL